MTTEEIRKAQSASPFRRYRVHTANGQAFDVPHPEFLALAPNGRTVVVFEEAGGTNLIDLLLVTHLEFPNPPGPRPKAKTAKH